MLVRVAIGLVLLMLLSPVAQAENLGTPQSNGSAE